MSKFITLRDAEIMTHAFQNSQIGANQTISCQTDKANLIELLNQQGCEGSRMYLALDSSNKLTLVIVGTDSEGNDMTNGKILNRFDKCPLVCPKQKSSLAL